MDSELSGGLPYPPFEQLGPDDFSHQLDQNWRSPGVPEESIGTFFHGKPQTAKYHVTKVLPSRLRYAVPPLVVSN